MSIESGDRSGVAPVVGRPTVDYLLVSGRQQLTELSAQADLKASIVITTSSVVLTLAFSRIQNTDYRASLAVLAVGVLGALIFAIFAVIPKFRVATNETMAGGDVNPLFFGHIANTSEDVYLEEMTELIRDDHLIYRAMLADIHAQSKYLIRAKYRWLRTSYVLLLIGFIGAAVVRIPSLF